MGDRAVYIVNVNGEQHRRPATNPYMPMHKIKKEIQAAYQLDYEFDLYYKGSKVLETSSLDENCFDDETPLKVVPRSSVRPTKLLQQSPRLTTIYKVPSRDSVFDEIIEDETETICQSSIVSNDNFQWKSPVIARHPMVRSVDEEEPHLSPKLSARRAMLPIEIPVDETLNGLPMMASHSRRNRFRSCSPVRHPTTFTISVSMNSPVSVRKNSAIRTESKERLDRNRLPIGSSNETSGYDSSTSSRSSSPDLLDFTIMVPAANRDMPKRTSASSTQMPIQVRTLDDVYSLSLTPETALGQLHNLMKQQLKQSSQPNKYSNRTHRLLFFNHRMHIFKNIDIDNERIDTIIKLKTQHHESIPIEDTPDFFVYALPKQLYENMYIFEKDPIRIFDNSFWWQSHSQVEQIPIAQSTLLSTLYVVYQYFRRPPLNEKATRRALEIQFMLYLRKYLFPPAFQAMKHMLIRQLFAFEKVILIDGLLHLLAQFCPSSIDKNLLGIYTPHLFSWLFEQSRNEMETCDGFLKFDLIRYSSNANHHFINDPVVIHDLDHDQNVLYEFHEAERYKNVTRNVDLFSLIKYLLNPRQTEPYDIDTYTIDTWGCHCMETIVRLTEIEISKLEDVMSRVYRSFTLLIRNTLENSDVRDQLILVNNKQVGICFKRCQRIKANGMLDQDLQCFMPADPLHSGIVTLNTSDVFEVENGRPDPLIPNSLRSNLQMVSKPIVSVSPIEQITVILLDISDSMFQKRTGKNNKSCRRFIDISINMLRLLSKNLHRQARSHAIGLILFGQDVLTHCPITTDIDEFERAIHRIPKRGQPWTSMYDAINTGFDSINQYESKHSVTSDCEKLIICITDGINNRGSLTLRQLKEKRRRLPVVIDLIFFGSQIIASYTEQQRQSIVGFRRFCNETRGIIYRNSSDDPLDLAGIFDQEAVLWLKARERKTTFGGDIGASVSHPSAKYPDRLYQPAVRVRMPQKFNDESHQGTDFYMRLQDEVNNIVRKQIENIQLYICRRQDGQLDYTFWKILLQV